MSDSPVTLITGVSRGIGKALAEHYLNKNHRVIGCSRSESTGPKGLAHFKLDVTDEPAVLKMFDEITAKYGRIDHLINNAGVGSMNHVLLTPTSSCLLYT